MALGAVAFGAFPVPAAPLSGVEVRKDPGLILRSPNPLDLETPVHLLDDWITPNERFYVRNHLYTPQVDAATWRLRVEGEVERPLSLALDELKRFDRAGEVVTIECAGSGRAFYQPRVAGIQWGKGAVGTARWAGLRLADLLKKAGAKKTGRHVAFDGADQSIGGVPDFIRSIPIEKCLHPATLLAWEMNGQPLPVQHGFPLRLIVPGWEGAASVKWLTRLSVQEREADGFFMATAYRYPNRPVAPGEAVDPADMQVLTSLDVKSIITAPGEGAKFAPGAPLEIRGNAWAGEAEVTRVDVSTDRGRTWQAAELSAERAPFAWRRFRYSWKAPGRGSYVLLSRATDTQGRVQPIAPQWNPSGYLWNVVDHVRIHVGDPAPATASAVPSAPAGSMSPAVLPDGPARALAERSCLTCHDATLITQQRMDRGRWVREMDKMIRWGAPVSPQEKEILVEYFYSHFR